MATVENKTIGADEQAFHGVSAGDSSIAIFGQSSAVGVRGDGQTWHGVAGISASTTGGAGVCGTSIGKGPGVFGTSKSWHGTYGETSSAGNGAAGVWGENKSDGAGVVGHSASGTGVYGKSEGGAAGLFDGRLVVTGNVEVAGDVLLLGADVAEDFDLSDEVECEPGTVMILDGVGRVRPSDKPYDRAVAGVVSGGGAYRPGILLDQGVHAGRRRPLALVGKVYCKVDASYGSIELGDLLVSSPTNGHAMKGSDQSMAFGAVLGKAMAPMALGTGLLPILVTLQ